MHIYIAAKITLVSILIIAVIIGGGLLVSKFFDMMGRIAEEEQ